jgi:ribosomal protein S18 acetylase RimI-like enzyme
MSAGPVALIVVRPSDPTWDARLDGLGHDIYHSAAYHAYAEASGEGLARLAIAERGSARLVWPYLMRRIPISLGAEALGRVDVTSVYGYPGPLATTDPDDPTFLADAFAAIDAMWRDEGVVAVFTRLHPLLDNVRVAAHLNWADPEGRRFELVDEGPTVAIDCRLGDADTLEIYPRQLRQQLRRGRSAGLETIHDTSWRDLEGFAAAYRSTMVRNHADERYFFAAADFARLRDALGGRLHLLVTRLAGDVAAGGLFTEFDGIVQAHLVGTAEAHRALSPFKVLLDDARVWARERGDRILHLGGGRGGANDELLRFKGLFSPIRHEFHTGRWILDPPAYRRLVAARQGAEDLELDRSFFPAYRAPIIRRENGLVGAGAAAPPSHAAPAARAHGEPESVGDGRDPSDARTIARDATVRADLGQDAPASPTPVERRLRILTVRPDRAGLLADLLPRIDPTWFRPHPMTAEGAEVIASRAGLDVYLVGVVDDEPIAYGMLRGWDEGYEVPTLGIAVRRDHEHRGYAREMMAALHAVAADRGARRVRLRVHPHNERALALYQRLGYAAIGVERGEVLMTLDLPAAGAAPRATAGVAPGAGLEGRAQTRVRASAGRAAATALRAPVR